MRGVAMSKQITLPDAIFQCLQNIAVPLVDTPASVIERLIDHFESHQNRSRMASRGPENAEKHTFDEALEDRDSRQRGVIVKVGDHTIRAGSVSDLYWQTLKYVSTHGYMDELEQHLPVATSSRRYLIAKSPIHPSGKEFVVPVKYDGYYMEAHKDYKNGLNHLRKMLDYCGLTLTYIG